MTRDVLRVLVADDEAMARRRLVRLLEALPDVCIVGEVSDGDEALERVRGGGVDLVLLDIQMPRLGGLDALALMPPDGPVVVFCTAHAEHAVAAFDVGAVDYLLKPIDAARLQKALVRARDVEQRRRFFAEASRVRATHGHASSGAMPDRFGLETRQGIVLLDPDEMTHAEIDGELVTVFTRTASYVCDLTLQALETRLAAHGFIRVHRRCLLNLRHVQRLEPSDTGGYVAHVVGGRTVEVSRLAARDLRKRLGLR